jgi:DMSO/TMAO reductase YedYZ molybdopterin-dependent catalytic subunit
VSGPAGAPGSSEDGRPDRPPEPGLSRAAHGAGAAAAALGAQWVLHRAYRWSPFAPYSLADLVIRRAPGWLAAWAIDRLGHADKQVLVWALIGGALVIGAALSRYKAAPMAAAAGVLSLAAAGADPRRPPLAGALLSAGVAVVAAGAVLVLAGSAGSPDTIDPGRRRLVAGLALLAVGAWLVPAALRRSLRHVPAELVRADRPAIVPPSAGFDAVSGLSPLVTRRAAHYTVDIDLEAPAVSSSSWRLAVGGLVSHPIRVSLAELRAAVTEERLATLSCVSNPVGGPLVGNARWTGVPLAELLRQARPDPRARFVVAHGADGYWETYPLDEVASGGPLVAVGMDGVLLPVGHGFPARLLVPGHYGMKSVKWMTRLEVVETDPVGYWGQRGWDEPAVTRTESRIDTPSAFAKVRAPFVVAGVAWAGSRRIAAVEVSRDGGRSWRPAELEREAGPLSWRRWRLTVDPPPGVHPVSVRATDGAGTVQDPRPRPAHPAGASGYHRITVTVLP